MFYSIKNISTILSILLIASCKKESLPPDENCKFPLFDNSGKNYLFFGHTYFSENKVDPRIEKIDYSQFDQIWLGGDLCAETTKEESTIDYLDNLFNLGSTNTHWALGNHDFRNGNINWVTSRTGRKTFYSQTFNGITLIVLNNNFNRFISEECAELTAQLQLIDTICDTIQQSSHLIVMSHQVNWGNIDNKMEIQSFANGDGSNYNFDCSSNGTFQNLVYPQLKKVSERGINVLCIAGDLGQKATEFEYLSDDGIFFLGSGITSKTTYNEQFPSYGKPDKVLIFTHETNTNNLYWEFVDLDCLSK